MSRPMPRPATDTEALTLYLQETADQLDDQARRLTAEAAALNPRPGKPAPGSLHARMLARNRRDLRSHYLAEATRKWDLASTFRARLESVIRDRDRSLDPVLLVLHKAMRRIERGWYGGPHFYYAPDGPRSSRCLKDFHRAIAWSLAAAVAEPGPAGDRLEPHAGALQEIAAVQALNPKLQTLGNAKDVHHALWLAATAVRQRNDSAAT